MTLTIKLTAKLGSAAGVNFNSDYSSYFSDLVPTGWPYILGGSGQFEGDQIVLLDKVVRGKEDETKSIILDGKDFNYYFNDHTLSGTLATVRLATLGDSYDSSNGSFDQDTKGHITNVTTSIEISGLKIFNAYGVRGDVHDVIYGLMGGAHDGGGISNPTNLSKFLWAEGHNVVGSTGADTYGGTKFADTVRGNGGNDVFDGKAGKDTAVFSGKKADYTITKNANGSVTVQDKRAGKDGKDTLKNIEVAKFSDATVDLTKLASANQAPKSIALSETSVAENTKVGTTVGIFSAVDPEGKALSYKLTDTAGGIFKLSGTKLQVAKAIDYEKLQSDTVTIEVSDAAGGTARKTFKIGIDDVTETISGTSSAETLKGGIGADRILGGAGNDTLYGYGGNDKLIGGTGADKLIGGAGTDTASYSTAKSGVTASLAKPSINKGDAKGDTYSSIASLEGSSYSDKLTGDDNVNVLTGGAGNDVLAGGGGNDTLNGGLGADDLYGGSGRDTFRFLAIKESTVASSGRDTIYDFSGSAGDRIHLSSIDAVTSKSGNQAFAFIGTDGFNKVAGELRYDKKASDTYIYGDVNGDGKADFTIHLDDAISLTKGYFIL